MLLVLFTSFPSLPLTSRQVMCEHGVRDALTVLTIVGKGESAKGVPLKLKISITSGEGRIYLSLPSLASEDLQASLKLQYL